MTTGRTKHCQKCGASEIPETMDGCPQCGAAFAGSATSPPKKTRYILWLFIGLIAIKTGALFFNDGRSQPKTIQTQPRKTALSAPAVPVRALPQPTRPAEQVDTLDRLRPETQTLFNGVVTAYINRFNIAANELQESSLRARRKKDLQTVVPHRTVVGWVGVIEGLSTTRDGRAAIAVRVAPGVTLKTWGNQLSDDIGKTKTLIETSSPLYSALLNATPGQRVAFSGSFLPSDKDFIEESSLTIAGAMQRPDFIFRFASISLL